MEQHLGDVIEDYCTKTGAKRAAVLKAVARGALLDDPIGEAIVRELRRFRRLAAPASRELATA